MPELPDLIYVEGRLREALRGQAITAARLTEPIVLRCLVKGDLSLLVGTRSTTSSGAPTSSSSAAGPTTSR